MNLSYNICAADGTILASNMGKEQQENVPVEPNRLTIVVDGQTGKPMKALLIREQEYSIHLATFDKNITKKIFGHYVCACKFFIQSLLEADQKRKERDAQNFRRLKHNIVTHNTNILQELEKAFPFDSSVKGANEQKRFIKRVLDEGSDDATISILKVIKSATLMRSDFDVYDILFATKQPTLDFEYHTVRKVVHLVMQVFWLEFKEKGITFSISHSSENALIDFRTVSVILSHIFDNMSKYCLQNTTVQISFKREDEHLCIYFTMLSLKITDEDYANLFLENYSGKYAKLMERSGNGIGMSVVERLMTLNNGKIRVERNISPLENKLHLGIPYEMNKIMLLFQS